MSLTYLENGWYLEKQEGEKIASLKPEIYEGALDLASILTQNNVPPEQVLNISAILRSLAPILSRRKKGFDTETRLKIAEVVRNQILLEPALDATLCDLLDHVNDIKEFFTLYLHFLHIGEVMMVLNEAFMEVTGTYKLADLNLSQDPNA